MDPACIAATLASAGALAASLYALRTTLRVKRWTTVVLSGAEVSDRVIKGYREAARRPRRRYIVFEVQSTRAYTEKDVARALIDEARRLLGEAGLVDSGIHLAAYYPEQGLGVLRVRSSYKYRALAILGMVRVGGEARLIPLYTSGTLKRALRKAGAYKS